MRALLLMGQSVYDRSSGAAQSMRQMAEALAWAGCEVRSMCTSGCENAADVDHWAPSFARQGQAWPLGSVPGSWLSLHDRGVSHECLVTAPARRHHWVKDWGAAFDARYQALLREFLPDVILTFGQDPSDQARWDEARRQGIKVILVLHNLVHAARPCPNVDACWAPSRFLSERYQAAWQRPVSVVPTPLGDYLRAATPRPRPFVTFINPEYAKGAAVVAGMLGLWLAQRPQQPLLVVEGRARAADWLSTLAQAGLTPTQCGQVFVSPSQESLADVWATTRVVLLPSVFEETAGRVALEAMLNGVVPVVSDRGALSETVQHAHFVQTLDATMVWSRPQQAPAEVCERWGAAIGHWLDDDEAWQQASAQAMSVAQSHLYPSVAPVYLGLIQRLMGC